MFMKKKKIYIAIGVLTILIANLLILNSCEEDKPPETFKIRNNTGENISSVFLKTPGSLLWGNDVLPYNSISNGSSVQLSISIDKMNSENRTDIQLRTSNEILYTRLSQKITNDGTVTFSINDLDSASPRTIKIGNSTDNTIVSIYFRQPGTLLWGNDMIPYRSVSNGNLISVVIPSDQMDDQYRTDIQLRTANGNLYTKLLVEIIHNGTITFINGDLDGASPRTINIGNVTGNSISSVYIRAPGTLLWGVDMIPYNSISNGSSRSITIPGDQMDSQYRTDIQLRTSEGNLYTKLLENIIHGGTVTFTSSDLDTLSPRTITLGNATGITISSVFIRLPGTTDWGDSLISYSTISNGSSRILTIPIAKMTNQYRTDIQIRASNGTTYTRLSEPIIHNGIVTFTSSDLGG